MAKPEPQTDVQHNNHDSDALEALRQRVFERAMRRRKPHTMGFFAEFYAWLDRILVGTSATMPLASRLRSSRPSSLPPSCKFTIALRGPAAFAEVWKQPELRAGDRSIVACTVLAVLGRNEELASHIKRAVGSGYTATELLAALV